MPNIEKLKSELPGLFEDFAPAKVHEVMEESYGLDEKARNDIVFDVLSPRIKKLVDSGEDYDNVLKDMSDANILTPNFYTQTEEGSGEDNRQALDALALAPQEAAPTTEGSGADTRQALDTMAETDTAEAANIEQRQKDLTTSYGMASVGGVDKQQLMTNAIAVPDEDQTPQELARALRGMKAEWLPLLSEALGYVSEAAEKQAKATYRGINEKLMDKLAEKGFESRVVENEMGDTQLMIMNPKTGKEEPFTRDVWDGIRRTSGATAGAIVAPMVVKGLDVARRIGVRSKGPAGALLYGAATVGGAMLGGGLDYVDSLLEAKERFDAKEATYKMLDSGAGEAVAGGVTFAGLKVLGLTGKAAMKSPQAVREGLHKIFNSSLARGINVKNAWKQLETITGKKQVELVADIAEYEARRGKALVGSELDKALSVVMNQHPEYLKDIVSAKGLEAANQGGKPLKRFILQRRKQVNDLLALDDDAYKALEDSIPEHLNDYIVAVKSAYGEAKRKGAEHLAKQEGLYGKGYQVNLDKIIDEEELAKVGDSLLDSSLDKDFQSSMRNLKEAKDTVVVPAKVVEPLKDTTGAIETVTKVEKARQAVEVAKRKKKLTNELVSIDERVKGLDRKIAAASRRVKNNKTERGVASAQEAVNKLKSEKQSLKTRAKTLKNEEKLVAAEERVIKAQKTSEVTDIKAASKAKQKTVKEGVEAVSQEVAGPRMGTFDNLIEVREAMNEFFRKKFADRALRPKDLEKFRVVKNAVDAEIENASKQMGEEGREWLKGWKETLNEYTEMSNLKHNKLYKEIVNADDLNTVITKISNRSTEMDTLGEVIEVLPAAIRPKAERAVIENLFNSVKYSNAEEGIDATVSNYVAISEKLRGMSIKDPENRRIVKVIDKFADLLRTDHELYKAFTGPSSSEVQAFSETLFGIIKRYFVVKSARRVMAFIPNKMGQELSMANAVGRLLDNPLNKTYVDDFIRKVNPDEDLITGLRQLQAEYRKWGMKARGYKAPATFGVGTADDIAPPVNKTPLGEFRVTYVDEAEALKASKGKGKKLIKMDTGVQSRATPEDIDLLINKRDASGNLVHISPKEYSNPVIRAQIQDVYKGIQMGNMVYTFP